MEEDEDMWKKIILSLLIIISGAAGFFVAKAQVTFNNTLNHVNRDYDTALKNVDLSGIEVNSDDDIVNILVVGNDYRKEKFFNFYNFFLGKIYDMRYIIKFTKFIWRNTASLQDNSSEL